MTGNLRRMLVPPQPAQRHAVAAEGVQRVGISLTKGGSGPYFALFWRALVQEAGERGTRFVEMSAPLESYARLPDAVLLHNTEEV